MSVFEKEYINNLLNEKQIKLPDDFYNYLNNLSKNKLIFYFYNDFNNDKNYEENIKIPKFYDNNIYKYDIDIEKIPNNTHKQVSIPLNVTKLSYYFPEVKYSEDDIEHTTNNNICINDVSKWMLEIGAFILRTETELLLKSRKVVSKKLEELGFQFKFKTFKKAVEDLL